MSPPNPHPSFKNPTIAEALCELHFELPEGKPWDASWFGELFKKAGDEYPKMEPGEVVEMGVGIAPDGFVQGIRRTGLRSIYHHKDRPHLFQLSETTFTINELRPYVNWERFINDIRRGWALLASTVGPAGLGRIGLRYINRIPRPNASEPISKWIGTNDYLPKKLLEARERFHSRTQIPIAEDIRLVVTVADLHDEDGARSILLDIDAILNARVPPELTAIEAQANRLHNEIWTVFDSCKTPALRALLDQEAQHVAGR